MSHKNDQWVMYNDISGKEMPGGVIRKILAYCDEMMCVENAFKQGDTVATHSHPHTQITYVTSGVFEFTVGDETRIIRQGDTLLGKDGIPHGCVCLEPGVLIEFFNPMREDFLK